MTFVLKIFHTYQRCHAKRQMEIKIFDIKYYYNVSVTAFDVYVVEYYYNINMMGVADGR